MIGAILLGAALLPPAMPAADDPATSRVDAIFADLDKPGSPGCALAVIRDGRIVHGRGYGRANLEHDVPITTRTVFDIGSTSKQFTAFSILLLARDGKLSLDDPVRRHVPELPEYDRPVTIRHLVHHTSGLRDYLGLMSLAGWNFEDVSTAADALHLIVRQRALNFEPGSEYLYSNTGYFLMGQIVERVSGKSLARFAQERIFGPLGMKDTHFHDDHTMVVPRRATGYSPRKDGGFVIDMSNFEQTGDGAVYTTVEDLLLWDRNFYAPQVGDAALLERMHTVGALDSGKPQTYAFALRVADEGGLRVVSHGGSWAGYRAELLRVPERRLSVACLCNLATAAPGRRARQVAEAYLGRSLSAGPEPARASAGTDAAFTVPAERPTEKAGLYRDPRMGGVTRVSVEDGGLVWHAYGEEMRLRSLGGDRFAVPDAPGLELVFERTGGGLRMIEREPDEEPLVRERIEPVRPDPAALAAYAGSYYSEELDTTYTIVAEGGALRITGRNRPKEPLEPTVRDEFVQGPTVFQFQRGPGGGVTGFTVGMGRIRGVRFVRR